MLRKVKALSAFLLIISCVSAQAENINFNFLSPSFGGNPNNGAFLVGLAQVQATATDRSGNVAGVGGSSGSPTVGNGDNVGGPTIIIPINTGSGDAPVVQAGDAAAGTEAGVDQVN
jgi:hypothetical protein